MKLTFVQSNEDFIVRRYAGGYMQRIQAWQVCLQNLYFISWKKFRLKNSVHIKKVIWAGIKPPQQIFSSRLVSVAQLIQPRDDKDNFQDFEIVEFSARKGFLDLVHYKHCTDQIGWLEDLNNEPKTTYGSKRNFLKNPKKWTRAYL